MSHGLLSSPSSLERFLANHHLPPLHRMGQHFLVDESVLERIVETIDPQPDIPLIEIGAGLGVLTRALAKRKNDESAPLRQGSAGQGMLNNGVAPIIAVELDRRIVPILTERMKAFPFVHVFQGDILKTSPESLQVFNIQDSVFSIHRYDVVGNIPYNITAKLLRHVLSWSPPPRRIIVLLDADVADRICATPPDMSTLAIAVQTFANPLRVGSRISPEAFLPPPKVQSSLVKLDVLPTPRVPPEEQEAFFRLVRAGFSQRRKMLQNTLAAAWHRSTTETSAILRSADIDPTRRAQTLTIEEWKNLLYKFSISNDPP